MRKKIVVGNWKMYTTPEQAVELAREISVARQGKPETQIVVCPPFTSLSSVSRILMGTGIGVGAQNMHWEDEGAFTGEISGKMLLTLGCTYVILGHSERRQHFFETDFIVNLKLKKALQVGLTPIVCIGETLEQREAGQTENVVKSQLFGSLAELSGDEFARTVLAYEPVWAIGTGRTATPKQAEEVHAFIRKILQPSYGPAVDNLTILYGGSIKPDNARELFLMSDIDGGLVGGASLKAESFLKIIEAAR